MIAKQAEHVRDLDQDLVATDSSPGLPPAAGPSSYQPSSSALPTVESPTLGQQGSALPTAESPTLGQQGSGAWEWHQAALWITRMRLNSTHNGQPPSILKRPSTHPPASRRTPWASASMSPWHRWKHFVNLMQQHPPSRSPTYSPPSTPRYSPSPSPAVISPRDYPEGEPELCSWSQDCWKSHLSRSQGCGYRQKGATYPVAAAVAVDRRARRREGRRKRR